VQGYGADAHFGGYVSGCARFWVDVVTEGWFWTLYGLYILYGLYFVQSRLYEFVTGGVIYTRARFAVQFVQSVQTIAKLFFLRARMHASKKRLYAKLYIGKSYCPIIAPIHRLKPVAPAPLPPGLNPCHTALASPLVRFLALGGAQVPATPFHAPRATVGART
jgi:hypothetical protein